MVNILIVSNCDQELNKLESQLLDLKIRITTTSFSKEDEAIAYLDDSWQKSGISRLPDLIILDTSPDKPENIDLLRRIKSRMEFATIPIILTTGPLQKNNMVEAYKYGGIAFLRKPCDSSRLSDILHRLHAVGILKTLAPR